MDPVMPKFSKQFRAPMLFVSFGIGLVLGYGSAQLFPLKKNLTSAEQSQKEYDRGYAAAKTLLEQRGILTPDPEHVYAVMATVTEKKNKEIVITVTDAGGNILSQNPNKTRTVTVTDSTEIARRTLKSPEEFSKEITAYNTAVQLAQTARQSNAVSPPLPPLPSTYKESLASLEDLAAGNSAVFHAIDDIKFAATFTASRIVIDGTLSGK